MIIDVLDSQANTIDTLVFISGTHVDGMITLGRSTDGLIPNCGGLVRSV
jgi:hypothetical protein